MEWKYKTRKAREMESERRLERVNHEVINFHWNELNLKRYKIFINDDTIWNRFINKRFERLNVHLIKNAYATS